MERLRKRADFLMVARGNRIPTAAFVLQALNRGDGGPIRVGFTISRKVGSAVERNRVRRRLRQVVRLAGRTDYVLVGRRAALSLPFEQLNADFSRAVARLRAHD